MAEKQLDIATRVVHAGERTGWPTGLPASTPIYASTTFTYASMADADAVLAGELSPGSVIVASRDLYGATLDLLVLLFGQFNIKTVTADFSDLASLAAVVAENRPRILIAETISNPLLKVCDIDACAEIAHSNNARLIVDNTFATPYLCRPFEHGADMVVHSATKYLSGHADSMGGLVIIKERIQHDALISIMKLAGGVLNPYEAHEILRGIKTLALRMERQCSNALRVARELQSHPAVSRVNYPALNPTNQAIAQRILRPGTTGAMISMHLADDSKE